jgi:hypothetical protein
MGAWGAGSFENDMALYWLEVFCSASNKDELLLSMLETITDVGDEYLDAADCSSCITAAEVIASLKNSPNPNFPHDSKQCVSESGISPDASLVELATKAVARVKANSELKELWDESENPGEWYSALGDLEGRLKQ